MSEYLRTNRIKLRNFIAEDSTHIKDLDSDPDVMKYISDGISSSDAEVERVIRVTLGWHKKHNGNYGYWVAELLDSNEFIGWFHLRPLKADIDNLNNLELGYRLKKKFWGQGIATEVSQALVDLAFSKLDAKEVWAVSMKKNLASQRIMQKCGMEYVRDEILEELHGPDKLCVWYKVSK